MLGLEFRTEVTVVNKRYGPRPHTTHCYGFPVANFSLSIYVLHKTLHVIIQFQLRQVFQSRPGCWVFILLKFNYHYLYFRKGFLRKQHFRGGMNDKWELSWQMKWKHWGKGHSWSREWHFQKPSCCKGFGEFQKLKKKNVVCALYGARWEW